jgi:hypothetical protein
MAVAPPAGSTRNWAAHVAEVAQEIESKFDVRCSTYPGHGRTGERYGIDIWVAPFRSRANADQEALGDAIQEYVERNHGRLGVAYIIWWNRMIEYGQAAILSRGGVWFSYEPYAFERPVGDPDPDTRRHLDHVHLQIFTQHEYQPPVDEAITDPDRELKDMINAYFASLDVPWTYRPVAEAIVEEARQALIPVRYPVSLVCAQVEQESWGRNIFGCDWGERWTDVPPYCQIPVTKERVQRLIANVEAGGGQNGVGLPQLTTIDLVYRAEALGGAHIPRNQLRVSCDYLAVLIRLYGYEGGLGAYNAGPSRRSSVRWTYTEAVIQKHNAWIARLT